MILFAKNLKKGINDYQNKLLKFKDFLKICLTLRGKQILSQSISSTQPVIQFSQLNCQAFAIELKQQLESILQQKRYPQWCMKMVLKCTNIHENQQWWNKYKWMRLRIRRFSIAATLLICSLNPSILPLQTELSHNLQHLSEKARSTTEFIHRLKGMSDKVTVSLLMIC